MAKETLSHKSFGSITAVVTAYSTTICAVHVQPLLPVERAINYGFISLVKSIFHACGRLPIHRKVLLNDSDSWDNGDTMIDEVRQNTGFYPKRVSKSIHIPTIMSQ